MYSVNTGSMRFRVVLFRQRGRTRGVSQVHPKDQEKRYHPHQRHGHYATYAVANKRRYRLNEKTRKQYIVQK